MIRNDRIELASNNSRIIQLDSPMTNCALFVQNEGYIVGIRSISIHYLRISRVSLNGARSIYVCFYNNKMMPRARMRVNHA